MAIFVITADTEANTLEVTVDGVMQENVEGVNVSKYMNYEGEMDVTAVVYSEVKEGGVRKSMRICAEQAGEPNYESAIKEALAYFKRG